MTDIEYTWKQTDNTAFVLIRNSDGRWRGGVQRHEGAWVPFGAGNVPLGEGTALEAAQRMVQEAEENPQRPAVVSHIVGNVEVGWKLWYDNAIQLVTGKRFGPPKPHECERQVVLFLRNGQTMRGDEAQTVDRVVED